VHLAAGMDGLLNQVLGVTVFTPDLGLGAANTKVTEVKTCKANTVKACKAAQG